MRRQAIAILGLLMTASTWAASTGTRIFLIAHDLDNHPLSGFYFTCCGPESKATTQAGMTDLDLPPEPGHGPGQSIKISLVNHSPKPQDWFLVNSQIIIPTGSTPAELILMRRSTFRQIAAEVRDAAAAKTLRANEQPSAEDQKRALVEAAARRGLTTEQLESAIRSFSETQDPKDRGIAAYLQGQYQQAEELLKGAAQEKESDPVETLLYLGATQYEQAKYRGAADSFRKALSLRSEDPLLLNWLGQSLYALADWAEAEPLKRRALAVAEKTYGPEHPNVAAVLNNLALLLQATNRFADAEPLMRRALAIDEKSYGPEHPKVATNLNNLALLLKATDRLAEAEPLMRRALAIDEKSYGPEHPKVATDLNNLAVLLKDTNRFTEAEPLMRRALDIDEKSYGPEHPEVATDLNNLALLLKDTNRFTEAEPLMRRALAIDEKSYGTEHPDVAKRLNSLALLLYATHRLAEAEPLMRRALAIDEKSYGPKHLNVARDLNNLASLLQATNRFAEAEPLRRRALAIDEESYGAEHPDVARDLNNLASLLYATNRLAEAEPLMRRALAILRDFSRRTGYVHPQREPYAKNYRKLLRAMGKSQAEIDETIKALE